MISERNNRPLETGRGQVMAYWMSSKREWRNFYRWQYRHRKLYDRLTLVSIVIAGTLLLHFLLQADWIVALLTSLLLAGAYGIVTYPFITSFIGVAFLKTNDIIITTTGVRVNGKFNSFSGDSKKIKQINIIDEANPKILHICYHHLTHKGTTLNEIHVPIPKGRLGEAVKIMQLLEA